jgi:hypothetical protein
MLSKFKEFSLSKNQLLQCKGGVSCSFYVTYDDGLHELTYSGECGGSDVASCNEWAEQNCNTIIAGDPSATCKGSCG